MKMKKDLNNIICYAAFSLMKINPVIKEGRRCYLFLFSIQLEYYVCLSKVFFFIFNSILDHEIDIKNTRFDRELMYALSRGR